MSATFDNSSDSYREIIDLIFSCRTLSLEERTKLLALAAFMTIEERAQISASLLIEIKALAECE